MDRLIKIANRIESGFQSTKGKVVRNKSPGRNIRANLLKGNLLLPRIYKKINKSIFQMTIPLLYLYF